MMHYSLLPFFLLKNPPPPPLYSCCVSPVVVRQGLVHMLLSIVPTLASYDGFYITTRPTIIKLRPASPSPLPLPPFSLPSSFLFRLFLFSLHFSAHPFQERKIRISPLSSPFLPPLLFSFPFLFSLFTKNVSAEAVQAPSLLFSDADEWDQLSWAGADQGCPSGWSPKHSWSFVAPPWCIYTLVHGIVSVHPVLFPAPFLTSLFFVKITVLSLASPSPSSPLHFSFPLSSVLFLASNQLSL